MSISIALIWYDALHCGVVINCFWDPKHVTVNTDIQAIDEPKAERIRIAEVHPYPDYDINDYQTDLHDLKLVRLAESVKNTPLARLMREDEEYLTQPGQMLSVAGWGAVDPTDLQGVGVMKLRYNSASRSDGTQTTR